MIWIGKLPLAAAQKFIGHTSHSLDPKSIILFCLKDAWSNKNMFVSLTYSETASVLPNKTMLCYFDKINCPGFITPA
jgi:hypothetical protein